jgi:hypothetical protein
LGFASGGYDKELLDCKGGPPSVGKLICDFHYPMVESMDYGFFTPLKLKALRQSVSQGNINANNKIQLR